MAKSYVPDVPEQTHGKGFGADGKEFVPPKRSGATDGPRPSNSGDGNTNGEFK